MLHKCRIATNIPSFQESKMRVFFRIPVFIPDSQCSKNYHKNVWPHELTCKDLTDPCIVCNRIRILLPHHQTQFFDLSSMLCTGGHNINLRDINGAMAQNIGQLGDILIQCAKASGKEVPQIVGKHLFFRYPCSSTDGFRCSRKGSTEPHIPQIFLSCGRNFFFLDQMICKLSSPFW